LVFAPTIGIFLGYSLSIFKNTFVRIFITLIPIFLGIWVFTSFSKIWQDFMIYRTFTSGETFRDSPMFTFYKDNHSVNNDYFKGKISVFFIWNTSCPYTPRYIPSLKNKLSKFSNNSKIKFYSVNIPMVNDAINADSAYLSNYNINIELLKGPAIEEMYKTFGQAPIPLTIILNPEGKIIYWGNVDMVDNTLQEL
jgi:thiol-disulfide isomerase/thioredoxin